MLLLAHTDAGRSLAKENIILLSIIEKAVRQAKHLDSSKKINISMESSLSIIGNQDGLNQVMMIILDNALNYSKADIKISAQKNKGKIEIQFENQGPGIPSDELSHIFERFYRPEENRTIPGFGLGLPIAKSLVEGTGGNISIQNQVGIGTNITILFKTI